MKDFAWTRQLVEELIVNYRKHDNLYNVKDVNYMNKTQREDAIHDITLQLQIFDNRITSEIVKNKIHNLRTQYARELRKVENPNMNATGTINLYKPKLWCYEQLYFLKSYCSFRKSQSNISQEASLERALDSLLKDEDRSPKRAKSDKNQEASLEKALDWLLQDEEPSPKRAKSDKNQEMPFENEVNSLVEAAEDRPKPTKSKINEETSFENEIDSTLDNIQRDPKISKKNYSIKILKEKLQQSMDLIKSRAEEKYDWLGTQVVFEINQIKTEEIQQEAAWMIQSTLKTCIKKDRLFRASMAKLKPQLEFIEIKPPPASSDTVIRGDDIL